MEYGPWQMMEVDFRPPMYNVAQTRMKTTTVQQAHPQAVRNRSGQDPMAIEEPLTREIPQVPKTMIEQITDRQR